MFLLKMQIASFLSGVRMVFTAIQDEASIFPAGHVRVLVDQVPDINTLTLAIWIMPRKTWFVTVGSDTKVSELFFHADDQFGN